MRKQNPFQLNPAYNTDWLRPFLFADPRMNNGEPDQQSFDPQNPFANIPTGYQRPGSIPNILDRIAKQPQMSNPGGLSFEDMLNYMPGAWSPDRRDDEPILDRSQSKRKREEAKAKIQAALAMKKPDGPRNPNYREMGLALLPMLFGAGTQYFGPMAQAFMQSRDNEEQRRYMQYQQEVQKQMSSAQMDSDEEARLREDENEDYASRRNKYESEYERKTIESQDLYKFDKLAYFQQKNPQEHERLKSIFDKSHDLWKQRIAKIEDDGVVTEQEIMNAMQAQTQMLSMFGNKYAGNFRIPEMGATEAQQKKDKDWETENRTSIQNQFKDLLETMPRGNGITNLHTGMVSNWLAEKGIDPRAFPPLVVGESWESWLARNGLTLRSQKERFARIPSRKEVEQKLYDINANRIKDRVSRLGPVGRNTAPIMPQPDTSMLRKFRKLYIGNKPGTKTDDTIERFIRYRENAISRNAWSESSENGFKQFIREVAGIDLDEDPKGII